MTPEGQRLMEAVAERGNLWRAYQRVVENKGAAGGDGLPVAEFEAYLEVHWPRIKQALLEGRYVPQPVRAAGHRQALWFDAQGLAALVDTRRRLQVAS